jgi:hypothetical protein
MARKRRQVSTASPPTVITGWKWRTLPVWMALTGGFVVGWYIAAIGAGFPYQSFSWPIVVLYIGLAGFSFGLSRIVNRGAAAWVQRRKLAKERKAEPEKRILSAPDMRKPR